MNFLDSSAIIPLLVHEPMTPFCLKYAQRAADSLIVWWGTPIECTSALARREREGALTPRNVATALERLRRLRGAWTEVSPSERLRSLAERLLRVHPLRAADALQLAAGITISKRDRLSVEFLSFDMRLRQAAEKEGFHVVDPSTI